MRTRHIGTRAVTEIGFGAAQLGNLYRASTDEQSTAAVDEAWSLGIRYFDTAPHYGVGLSERRLGQALAGRPREDFVVSTKVGRLLVATPERAAAGVTDEAEGFAVPATHRREWDFSRDGIVRSVEASLERLQLDRLDIVYLHDPDAHWQQASTSGVDALVELRDQGVVGAIGAGMNQSAMLSRFVRECDIDVVMLAGRYTLLDRSAQDDLMPLAHDRGVAVVAAAVYNSGLLSSATIADDALFNYERATPLVIDRARALAATCAAAGVELPEAAVQFALRSDAVASVVVGMRTPEHVQSTVERYLAEVPPSLWRQLESA